MSQAQLDDIKNAYYRINKYLNRTELVSSELLNKEIGAQVYLKPEQLQKTGSFKIRGALSAMTLLDKKQLQNGVIAFSSGNHAQGIAYAAKLLNSTAVIVMPRDAPKIKIKKTKALGARVIFYDRQKDIREEIGETIALKENRVLIKPFDSIHVISGQGTAALEVIEAEKNNKKFDAAIICASGGGLAAGTSIVLKNHNPKCEIYTAEPAAWNDHQQSFAANKRIYIKDIEHGICDALESPVPGKITFAINNKNKVKGLSVDNNEIIKAMRFAYEQFNFILEPSGAIALACLKSEKIKFKNKKILIMLSGGNISKDRFYKYIAR